MDVSWILSPVVVESMSKSAFLDMLKSSSDKARTQETNEKQKEKVIINVNVLTKPSKSGWSCMSECKSSSVHKIGACLFEPGYFEFSIISNLKRPFPLDFLFSNLLSHRLFRTIFRFSWEFEIAGFNCT